MSVGCLLLVVLVVGITAGEAAACGDVVTAGDRDLETGGGVEAPEVGGGVGDREVGGGDT